MQLNLSGKNLSGNKVTRGGGMAILCNVNTLEKFIKFIFFEIKTFSSFSNFKNGLKHPCLLQIVPSDNHVEFFNFEIFLDRFDFYLPIKLSSEIFDSFKGHRLYIGKW